MYATHYRVLHVQTTTNTKELWVLSNRVLSTMVSVCQTRWLLYAAQDFICTLRTDLCAPAVNASSYYAVQRGVYVVHNHHVTVLPAALSV
jgi:hypothetical protein